MAPEPLPTKRCSMNVLAAHARGRAGVVMLLLLFVTAATVSAISALSRSPHPTNNFASFELPFLITVGVVAGLASAARVQWALGGLSSAVAFVAQLLLVSGHAALASVAGIAGYVAVLGAPIEAPVLGVFLLVLERSALALCLARCFRRWEIATGAFLSLTWMLPAAESDLIRTHHPSLLFHTAPFLRTAGESSDTAPMYVSTIFVTIGALILAWLLSRTSER